MSDKDIAWQERRLEEILDSGADAATKSQQIIRLGFDAEIADELVAKSQLGTSNSFFESLRPDELPIYDNSDETDDLPRNN